MNFIRFAAAVLALMLGMLAGPLAQAASCSALGSGGDALLAGSPGDLDTADMTFRGSEADGCSGLYQGNSSAAEVHTVAAQLGSVLDPLQAELKADGAAAGGLLSYQGGSWTLAYGADLAGAYDLIVVVKQATGWAAAATCASSAARTISPT